MLPRDVEGYLGAFRANKNTKNFGDGDAKGKPTTSVSVAYVKSRFTGLAGALFPWQHMSLCQKRVSYP